MDPSLIVPTFRYPRTFARPLSNPWGIGTTGTSYEIKDGKVRVHLEDASPLTSGLSSVRQTKDEVTRPRRRQRGKGVTPADMVRMNRLRARMPGLNRPAPRSIRQMENIIRRRHAPSTLRRQTAASRAYVNRPMQRVDRAVNRGLRSLRNRLTPQTLTGKLKLGAGLGAAGLGLSSLLGGVLGGVLSGRSKQRGGGFLGLSGADWKKAWRRAQMFAG